MGNRTSRSLAVLCILLIGVVVYLLTAGPQKPEVAPSVEIAAPTTDAPAPDTAAASADRKIDAAAPHI